jgi:ArsR family transcriptional regulator
MFAERIDVCQYRLMSISSPSVPCCAPVLHARLGKADAEELATAFRAIADPGRLRLLSLIAAQPDGEACVCNLLKPLGLSQPTVSHHLKVLFEAGLLGREKRGSWVYYRVLPERMAELRDVLAPPKRIEKSVAKRSTR